jgi:hypothetical protein
VASYVIHYWGRLSRNSGTNFPQLTTSWYSNSETVWSNACVDHRGFPLRVMLNWSRCFLRTPVGLYILHLPLSTSICSYSHPITYCFLWLLCSVFPTIFKYTSWVLFSVNAIVVSWWTNCSLRCYCVSAGYTLDETPVVRHDSDPIAHGWGVCGAITCCCGKVREMITKRSGKSWGIYRYL